MKSSVGFRFSVISACAVVAGCRFSIESKTVARKRSGGVFAGAFPQGLRRGTLSVKST